MQTSPELKMIKNITREELVTTYKDNHGFAFVSNSPIRDESIHALAETIKNSQVSPELPKAVTRYKQSVIFIYDKLDAPEFFRRASYFEQAFGVARIVPFLEYVSKV
jgi:hypothetical protein